MKRMHRPRSTAFEIFMRALHTQLLGFLVPLLAFSLVVLGVAYVVQAKQAKQAVLGTAQALQDCGDAVVGQGDMLDDTCKDAIFIKVFSDGLFYVWVFLADNGDDVA